LSIRRRIAPRSGAFVASLQYKTNVMPDAPLHVVFGAGQIGSQVAELLARRGLRVRVVRRSKKPAAPGIEVVTGDARDPAFAASVTQGAAVIYHCMNPSRYNARAWEEELPRLGEALIHAATQNHARLVCLDNLYAYGETDGRRTEATPLRAQGRKGKVRAAWAERLEQARREQGLRFVLARAGDFFGPGTEQSVVSETVLKRIQSAKPAWVVGDPRAPHAFSFAPDVAAALVALGTAEADVEGQVFHVPVLEISTEQLVAGIAKRLGTSAGVRAGGRTMLALLSPVVPIFRELLETFYQWDRPFLVDDSKFRARFPNLATSLEAALDATASQERLKPETAPRPR
jgi:nucleoside-diphosphate-sugar epimerase